MPLSELRKRILLDIRRQKIIINVIKNKNKEVFQAPYLSLKVDRVSKTKLAEKVFNVLSFTLLKTIDCQV